MREGALQLPQPALNIPPRCAQTCLLSGGRSCCPRCLFLERAHLLQRSNPPAMVAGCKENKLCECTSGRRALAVQRPEGANGYQRHAAGGGAATHESSSTQPMNKRIQSGHTTPGGGLVAAMLGARDLEVRGGLTAVLQSAL